MKTKPAQNRTKRRVVKLLKRNYRVTTNSRPRPEEGDPLACLHSPCKVVRVGLRAKTAVIACSTFSKCGCQEVCARGRTWARKCAQNWFTICRIKGPSGFCCSLSRIGQTSITSNKSESRTLIPKLSALASQRHKPNSRKKPTSWKHSPHQR